MLSLLFGCKRIINSRIEDQDESSTSVVCKTAIRSDYSAGARYFGILEFPKNCKNIFSIKKKTFFFPTLEMLFRTKKKKKNYSHKHKRDIKQRTSALLRVVDASIDSPDGVFSLTLTLCTLWMPVCDLWPLSDVAWMQFLFCAFPHLIDQWKLQ